MALKNMQMIINLNTYDHFNREQTKNRNTNALHERKKKTDQ